MRARAGLAPLSHPPSPCPLPPPGETLISIGLWIAGYFPGLIHALVVVNSDGRLNVCTSRLALNTAPGENLLGSAQQSLSAAAGTTRPTAVPTEATTTRPFVGTGGSLAKGADPGLASSPADPKAM